jgi:Mrp family chromosome partitioning ATPase
MLGQELLARHVERGRRGLAVCATSAGAGVTFSTTQLALVFAHFGLATLLVEANLHDPRLHELIVPPDPANGLLQYLESDEVLPADIIHRDVAENLSIVYAGGTSPRASELIAGERLRPFIAAAMRDFDVTLVDTPGANRTADSRWIAHLVGYALVLGRRDVSFVDDLAELVRELKDEDVEIVGTMLNGA